MTILRPPRTPEGTDVRTVVKHVTKGLRRHWPNSRIVWRGDSHYGRVEATDWAEDNDAGYIFGLPSNAVLDAPSYCEQFGTLLNWVAGLLAFAGFVVQFALDRYVFDRRPKGKTWLGELWGLVPSRGSSGSGKSAALRRAA